MKKIASFITSKKAVVATALISATTSFGAFAADEASIDFTQLTDKITFANALIALMAAGGAILSYNVATKGIAAVIKAVKAA